MNYKEPPAADAEVQFPVRASTIAIPIVASLDDIQSRLETEAPNPLAVIDENRDACVPAKWIEVCVLPRPWGGCAQWLKTKATPDIDCHLSGAVGRGAISLGGSGNTLTVQMPVNVQITARGRGDIGKNIRETATGAADVLASAAVDLDEGWNPSAQLTADYAWTDRLGVNILGFRITFASKADEKIKEELGKFQASLPQRLNELDVRGQAEKAWASAFTVMQVNADPDVWIRFTPQEVGFSGLNIQDRTATASLYLSGATEVFVGKEPAKVAVTPLPPLKKAIPETGFEINLPMQASYESLRETAKKAIEVGKRRDVDVEGIGTVGVTVHDIMIRASGAQQLAVGVTLTADPPTGLFDTRGVVWLTGAPEVDNDAKKVSVKNLMLYGVTDNQVSDVLIEVVQTLLATGAFDSALSYDFSEDYARAMEEANKLMTTKVTDDVLVEASLSDATVDAIIPGASALYLVASARGAAAVKLAPQ